MTIAMTFAPGGWTTVKGSGIAERPYSRERMADWTRDPK